MKSPQADLKDHVDKYTKFYWVMLIIVGVVGAGYMATHLKRQWVPNDEGILGLSAERVLKGELPNRDFDDYTGGLTFVHALAFRAIGISSAAMRMVLFIFFLAWVPAVFFVATRFSPPWAAGVVTLLAVVWSVPNYPGPMPSWYNLFFATFGMAALLRYVECERRWWLFVAGLCGGLSALAKITAAYYIAGALLFFVFREQAMRIQKRERAGPVETGTGWFYSTMITMALVTFSMLLFRMVRLLPGVGGLFFLMLPATALVVLLIAREFTSPPGRAGERFKALLGMVVPFGVGIVAPLLVFLVPYVRAGAAHALALGLLATPTRAVRFATHPLGSPLEIAGVLPFVVPLVLAYDLRGRARVIFECAFAGLAGAIAFLSTKSVLFYGITWSATEVAIPVLAVVGALVLWMGRTKLALEQQQQLMLTLSVASLCSLIVFPFAGKGYFLYVMPLAILAAAALFGCLPNPPKLALVVLAGFYLAFALFSVTAAHLGLQREENAPQERLTMPRAGGLFVEAGEAEEFNRLIPLIQEHAKGRFIYAAPDCPEVYFLSGLESFSRHYYDFAEDQPEHDRWVLQQIESHGVTAVTICRDSSVSPPMSQGLKSELERRYPEFADVGQFRVRWREQQ